MRPAAQVAAPPRASSPHTTQGSGMACHYGAQPPPAQSPPVSRCGWAAAMPSISHSERPQGAKHLASSRGEMLGLCRTCLAPARGEILGLHCTCFAPGHPPAAGLLQCHRSVILSDRRERRTSPVAAARFLACAAPAPPSPTRSRTGLPTGAFGIKCTYRSRRVGRGHSGPALKAPSSSPAGGTHHGSHQRKTSRLLPGSGV